MWKNPTSSLQEPEIMGTLQKTCQVPSHQRSIIKNVRDDLITLPETNMFAPIGRWISFWDGTEGICYDDILCRWRHILHIFPTNMDNMAIIHSLSRPFEFSSPNQPTEFVGWVSFTLDISFGCWFDPFFSKHLRRWPRLQRWLSWTRLICFRQMLGLRSYHEVGFNHEVGFKLPEN